MKQNKDNICPVDTDKAWNILYSRLEEDRLLPGETTPSSYRTLQWVIAVAAVLAGVILSIFYFPKNKDNSLFTLQNTENTGTLVTML